MERCATCRHWDTKDDDASQYEDGIGRCAAAPMFWDTTEWSQSEGKTVRERKPEYANTKAFVQDGSDYYAYLLTLPDFGCVMHEATPAPPAPE